MICHNCGSDLNSTPNSPNCPHAGVASSVAVLAAAERQLASKAIQSGARPSRAKSEARRLTWEHTGADVLLLGERGATPGPESYRV